MSKLDWAQSAKLNDVYWSACEEYTKYMQTGSIGFKSNAEQLFRVYKERGGKREKLIMH